MGSDEFTIWVVFATEYPVMVTVFGMVGEEGEVVVGAGAVGGAEADSSGLSGIDTDDDVTSSGNGEGGVEGGNVDA